MHLPFKKLSLKSHGFSLVEMLIVSGICAMVFTGAAFAYQSVTKNQRRISELRPVTIASAAVSNNSFDGVTKLDTWAAPNVGRSALANEGRALFLADVESSVAVFMLPREGNINAARRLDYELWNGNPSHVNFVDTGTLDTPNAFRQFMLERNYTSANVFTPYANIPTQLGNSNLPLVNGSIYCFRRVPVTDYKDSATRLSALSIWEIDYIQYQDTDETPAQPYVFTSVRRFAPRSADNVGLITFSYDFVIKNKLLANVGVPFVHFGRAASTGVVTPTMNLAINQPFYMVWWPDPSIANPKPPVGAINPSLAGNVAGAVNYASKNGTSTQVMIVPQFPTQE